MTAALFVLLILVIVQFVVIVKLTQYAHRERSAAQVRFLNHLNERQEDIRQLTMGLVNIEGRTPIRLQKSRPPEQLLKVPSWYETKPPEAFVKPTEPAGK